MSKSEWKREYEQERAALEAELERLRGLLDKANDRERGAEILRARLRRIAEAARKVANSTYPDMRELYAALEEEA